MKELILKELNKILTLLQNIDFNSYEKHTKNANQKNVIEAYSRLFDLIQFIKKEGGKSE